MTELPAFANGKAKIDKLSGLPGFSLCLSVSVVDFF